MRTVCAARGVVAGPSATLAPPRTGPSLTNSFGEHQRGGDLDRSLSEYSREIEDCSGDETIEKGWRELCIIRSLESLKRVKGRLNRQPALSGCLLKAAPPVLATSNKSPIL
ncbi:unnamed protein product [Danaus chrysippus]|uniref:(African queen) hypothetical protein n=1 Tax=Danaus chrysippus TaxID=151541 RepID=A0A8J2QH89_9NEOP|nr:unnamed protein product [Danaus chrysippus]